MTEKYPRQDRLLCSVVSFTHRVLFVCHPPSGSEESRTSASAKAMKNPFVRHPLLTKRVPSPCHPDRSAAERRDLQFRGPFVGARNTALKQDCHLDWSVLAVSCHQHWKLFVG